MRLTITGYAYGENVNSFLLIVLGVTVTFI